MENVILQQNKHWKDRKYSNLYERDLMKPLKKRLKLKEIQILLGVRRSGKSTLFKLIINHLLEENDSKEILYINFDDPFFSPICKDSANIYSLFEMAEKLTGTKIKYLFLDEVQAVNGWEKLVKSVYDSEVFNKIFITGSNSSLLKSEYAALLSGRYTILNVFPFTYHEILKKEGINSYINLVEKKVEALKIIDEMSEFGSFPEVLKCDDFELKREIILGYYETILLKDCILNGAIRDTKSFKELSHYLLSNCAALFSYNNIAKAIESSDQTVKEFIHILENSFLTTELKTYSYSLKQQIRNKKKVYSVDNSFPANISFRFSSNKGKLFENLVFTELMKQGGDIFFFNDTYECDFIVQKNTLTAYQVCYDLNSENRKRELNGLTKTMKKFNISQGVLITYNQEEVADNIHITPFWKYFANFVV